MTTPSPSEFLTFHRRLTTSLLYRSRPVHRLPVRQFAASSITRAGTGQHNTLSNSGTQQGPISGNETGASREHAVDKGEKGDPSVQSYESKNARRYVPHPPAPPTSPRHHENEHERRYTPALNLRTGSEAFSHPTSSADQNEERTYADVLHSLRSQKARDTGGHALRQKDERDSTAKAKKEHPEAPDVVIGMQDERGGKGV
jgi:hypothetical protein